MDEIVESPDDSDNINMSKEDPQQGLVVKRVRDSGESVRLQREQWQLVSENGVSMGSTGGQNHLAFSVSEIIDNRLSKTNVMNMGSIKPAGVAPVEHSKAAGSTQEK